MLFLFQELMWQLATWQVATSFLACRWRNCAIVLPSAAEAQEGPMAWHCARVLRGTWPVSRPVAPPALSCATTTPRRCPARRGPNVRDFSSRVLLGNKLHPGHSHLFSQHHACGLS